VSYAPLATAALVTALAPHPRGRTTSRLLRKAIGSRITCGRETVQFPLLVDARRDTDSCAVELAAVERECRGLGERVLRLCVALKGAQAARPEASQTTPEATRARRTTTQTGS
jgi:hypothetical protein